MGLFPDFTAEENNFDASEKRAVALNPEQFLTHQNSSLRELAKRVINAWGIPIEIKDCSHCNGYGVLIIRGWNKCSPFNLEETLIPNITFSHCPHCGATGCADGPFSSIDRNLIFNPKYKYGFIQSDLSFEDPVL